MGKGFNCKGITANLLLLVLFSAESRATNGDMPEVLCVGETCENAGNACQRNCSGQPFSALCSSNGQTFDNVCEFEKLKCQRNENWLIIYYLRCSTLPPPPEVTCRQHQNSFYNYGTEEYDEMCNTSYIERKAANGTLELSDIIQCYTPHCTRSGNYSIYQCSYNAPDWCWCSDPNGIAIEGTFKKSLASKNCYNRSVCNYNGREYKDAKLFIAPNQCGLCECLDGTVTCWCEYNPNNENELNKTQIVQFVNEVTQLFNWQYGRRTEKVIDIRHISRHPITMIESMKHDALQWKFERLNTDNNDVLSASEQFKFRNTIDSFLFCISFFNQIIELIDDNDDSQINRTEWSQFFTNSTVSSLNIQRKRRSAPSESLPRELGSRKKFYYTLA